MWSAEQGLLALDLDGTLIDARRRQLTVLAKALADLELPPVPYDLFWERKRAGEKTVEALIALDVEEGEARAAAARWIERIEDEDEFAGDLFLPGVEETLADLATRDVRPVVVTARVHPDRARRQFATLGLDRWCDGLHVVEPSRAAEQKAATLRELGAAAYIGDTESDARAASLAQIPFAAVGTGQRSPTFLTTAGLTPHPTLALALGALSA